MSKKICPFKHYNYKADYYQTIMASEHEDIDDCMGNRCIFYGLVGVEDEVTIKKNGEEISKDRFGCRLVEMCERSLA